MTRCFYCDEPIERVEYRRVTGWERKAVADSRKGGSDIILREPIDEYACPRCIVRLQQGLAPAQEQLL